MNTGVVAYRYGKALLKYVQERGTGEMVYRQVLLLVQRMSSYEQLKHILENRDDVPQQQKKELMAAAVEETLAPELASFADLVHSQGPVQDAQLVHYAVQGGERHHCRTSDDGCAG